MHYGYRGLARALAGGGIWRPSRATHKVLASGASHRRWVPLDNPGSIVTACGYGTYDVSLLETFPAGLPDSVPRVKYSGWRLFGKAEPSQIYTSAERTPGSDSREVDS